MAEEFLPDAHKALGVSFGEIARRIKEVTANLGLKESENAKAVYAGLIDKILEKKGDLQGKQPLTLNDFLNNGFLHWRTSGAFRHYNSFSSSRYEAERNILKKDILSLDAADLTKLLGNNFSLANYSIGPKMLYQIAILYALVEATDRFRTVSMMMPSKSRLEAPVNKTQPRPSHASALEDGKAIDLMTRFALALKEPGFGDVADDFLTRWEQGGAAAAARTLLDRAAPEPAPSGPALN